MKKLKNQKKHLLLELKIDNKKEKIRLINLICSAAPKVRDVKKCLIEGTDINYQTIEKGYTALMFASKNQHDRIVDYLLRQGANPLLQNHANKRASDLITPDNTIYPILKDFELLFAVLNNDFLTAQAAISAGALINFKGVGGYTPLMIAVEQNQVELVVFLLEQGADATLTLANGLSVFDLVTDENILQLLKETSSFENLFQSTEEKYSHSFFKLSNSLNNY